MALKLTLVTAPSPTLRQSSLFRGAQAMAAVAIHVVPDDNFDDWVVRADIGQEFGHYPTREAAFAQAIAHEREAELVVHLPDRKTSRTRFAKSWTARLFRR
jgi:urease accessory protein UreF